jgi:transcription elongation GreA/GreB family factor
MPSLDDLILRAATEDSSQAVADLLAALRDHAARCAVPPAIGDALAMAFDSWADGVAAPTERAEFCFQAASLCPQGDSPGFRNALQRALRCLLADSATIPKPIAIEGIGLRDNTVHLPEIARRFSCLRQLRQGRIVAIPEQNLWGFIKAIDEFTGEIRLQPCGGREIMFPLAGALRHFLIFEAVPTLAAVVEHPAQAALPSASTWRALLHGHSLMSVTDDDTLRRITLALLVPARFSALPDFEAWWNTNATVSDGRAGEGEPVSAPTIRQPAMARSLAELHLLLTAFDRSAPPDARISATDAAPIARLFATAKPPSGIKAEKELAASVVLLIGRLDPDAAPAVMAPLRTCAPWWPAVPDAIVEAPLWDNLPAAQTAALLRATRALFPEEYCRKLAIHLPPKCWPAALAEFGEEAIQRALAEAPPPPPAAAILWKWKAVGAKAGLPWPGSVVLKSLAAAESARAAAAKSLRNLVLDHAGFQNAMLAATAGDESSFLVDLQHAEAFNSGEKQSLMVKLSRISPRIQALLEAGQGRSIMAAQARTSGPEPAANKVEPQITSIRSYRQRIREFEDLVNRQFPENSAAIAHAREYGDLRENAEYKAAKERQRFLTRRHHELKQDLDAIQAVDFSLVQVKDFVIPGCLVTLVGDDSHPEETHALLGAWDGNPERHHLASNTPLGQALVGQQVGDAVTLPDGRTVRITAIAPLPKELVRELNDDGPHGA